MRDAELPVNDLEPTQVEGERRASSRRRGRRWNGGGRASVERQIETNARPLEDERLNGQALTQKCPRPDPQLDAIDGSERVVLGTDREIGNDQAKGQEVDLDRVDANRVTDDLGAAALEPAA